jgi:hypothetical protein
MVAGFGCNFSAPPVINPVRDDHQAMNHPDLEQLMDLARRRVLTAEEQARLTAILEADPAAWPDRDEEVALTRLLVRMPDAPLASNFASRVMQAIDLAEAAPGRGAREPFWWPRRRFGRLAWVTAMIAVAGISWRQYQSWQRTQTARSLQVITEVAAVPSVDVLRDFDAIQSFARVPPSLDEKGDLELLKALQ